MTKTCSIGAGKGANVEDAERRGSGRESAPGIKVAGHFVLGIPGETKESLDKTLALARTRFRSTSSSSTARCRFPARGSTPKRRRRGGLKETQRSSATARTKRSSSCQSLDPEEVMEYRRVPIGGSTTRPSVALGALDAVAEEHRSLRRIASSVSSAGLTPSIGTSSSLIHPFSVFLGSA